MRHTVVAALFLLLACRSAWGDSAQGLLVHDFDPHARYTFGGPVGQRVDANARNWLIRAPQANPGLVGMFALRDRQPKPELVPWAGEFVGKYLISAVQALRMTDETQVKPTVDAVLRELIASQAEDGYLGPFPKAERLLGQWDLWGHYHVMLALLMWHEQTGDAEALKACQKAGDLICATYLDTGRRPRQAGSSEMNLAVIHGLGRLYRVTADQRYLRMMREIEKDWEQEGDYFRTGLAGVEYFRTPKPRWESLHDVQGLVELYRITDDQRYRTSFLHHWYSIRRWDRRNTGGFSSGEQATGTPYEPSAIETCCTIAWMAVTVDALRLTGNSQMADELELSTFNGMLGAQHPSGNWCTYNTPINGIREASHHTIVFQARAGTPDLNCCSVNGPRGLGMLSEWAVLRAGEGLALNYYGPMKAALKLADGTGIKIQQDTRYPLDGQVRIRLEPEKPKEFPILVRIPAWAKTCRVEARGKNTGTPRPGTYCEVRGLWQPGDEIVLSMEMPLRYESGDGDMFGRMSVYRGPILLAYDVLRNDFDEAKLPAITPKMLPSAKIHLPEPQAQRELAGRFEPWIIVEIPLDNARILRLCDYASAGSSGNRYLSWLPAQEIVPPAPVPDKPGDGAIVPPGRMLFTWRMPASADAGRKHRLLVGGTPDVARPLLESDAERGPRLVVSEKDASRLKPGVDYYWRLVATNAAGSTESLGPASRFRIDPNLPPLADEDFSEYGQRADGVLVAASLAGNPKPEFGKLLRAEGCTPAAGPDGKPQGAVALDGQSGMLVYKLRAFPRDQYTVSFWFAHNSADGRFGQLFSSWCRGLDDPLRICVVGGRLSARTEAGNSLSTDGVPVERGRWYHAAAVKSGGRLTLYLDGKAVGTMSLPAEVHSQAQDFALGGNPHYTGASEFLPCRVAKLTMRVQALSPGQVAALYDQQRPR